MSGAREGGRIGSREAAIGDRQGAVLRASEVRRDPGHCSGCEGRCTFPVWSGRQDQFAGWIPVRGPGAGAGRAGPGLGGALSFLYFYVSGGEGPDTIDGGAGDDYLYLDYSDLPVGQNVDLSSGNATDGSTWTNVERFTFYGSSGNDTARGSSGYDYLYGNAGADLLEGGADGDNLYGEAGNDTLNGFAGSDYLLGGDGDDDLSGGDDGDSLYGEAGADRIDAGAGNDYIYINSDDGPDTVDGGEGEDYLYLDYSGLQVGQNADLASGNATDGSTWTNVERLSFYGGSGGDTARGGSSYDYLYGYGGADLLEGGGDADYLVGGEGDDTLRGGDDVDTLYGLSLIHI